MTSIKEDIVLKLIEIEAIKLQPENPFTWASGWKSPIYCDNRKALAFPDARKIITLQFSDIIKSKYPNVEVIVGVATGAIAIGVLVAEELGLPFVYVRSAAKGHGLGNLIEGKISEGQKTVIIEDLISTGGSSLKAVDAIRNAKCEVLGMLAIFTYGFSIASKNFENANCELTTLGDYDNLIIKALEKGLIDPALLKTLQEWRKYPETWGV